MSRSPNRKIILEFAVKPESQRSKITEKFGVVAGDTDSCLPGELPSIAVRV